MLSLTGGAGADSFAYTLGSGRDAVRDFVSGADMIVVDDAFGLSGFADLQISQSGANTFIGLASGGTDTLILLNTSASTLTAADFVFEGAGNTVVVSDDILPLDADLSDTVVTAQSPDTSLAELYAEDFSQDIVDGLIEFIDPSVDFLV